MFEVVVGSVEVSVYSALGLLLLLCLSLFLMLLKSASIQPLDCCYKGVCFKFGVDAVKVSVFSALGLKLLLFLGYWWYCGIQRLFGA